MYKLLVDEPRRRRRIKRAPPRRERLAAVVDVRELRRVERRVLDLR